MQSTPVNSPLAPGPSGGYSQALDVRGATRWLVISGQIPVDRAGGVPESFAEQADLVWANILAQLDAAGLGVANLVKVATFLSSRQYADENGDARRRALGSHAPALTVIIAGIYDEEWLLEIEAIAAA
ncbi:RidA family protein [Acidovorax sp. LjRoot66]|uniref:RidA family protein n=1 Tax=Acidovorax sp. LjRoot66 TaxID=3342334 RepID=UPI003ECE454A